jgi:hypothetical protein
MTRLERLTLAAMLSLQIGVNLWRYRLRGWL